MSDDLDMGATNLRIYQDPSRARWYATLSELTPAEEAGFARTSEAWRGGDVLDIGIGGGRTVMALAKAARSYVGVDYSDAMLAVARARYPKLDLRQADARDLAAFADGAFDFAFFADNGIDAVDDIGRGMVLAEVLRVLKPGGVFLFNSHNLDCAGHNLRDLLRVRISRSPVATLKSLARIPIRLRNYVRSSGYRRRAGRYAILTDPGNDFSSPHYYTTAPETRRQLEAVGFEVVQVLDSEGAEVVRKPDRISPTLYFVARRPPMD
jgi:SAM-dependent methyltransferase